MRKQPLFSVSAKHKPTCGWLYTYWQQQLFFIDVIGTVGQSWMTTVSIMEEGKPTTTISRLPPGLPSNSRRGSQHLTGLNSQWPHGSFLFKELPFTVAFLILKPTGVWKILDLYFVSFKMHTSKLLWSKSSNTNKKFHWRISNRW